MTSHPVTRVRLLPVASRAVRGFTLIELLVVMVIIGIVATILIGFFVKSYRKTQLRDGAVQILTDLRQARSQAQRVSQGSTVALDSTATMASPNKKYTTVWGSGSPQTTTNRTLTDPVRVAPYAGGTINSANSISYSAPYGEVLANGIVWEVSSTVISDKLYVKAIGVTGKVVLSASPN
ncbi:Tfp pilus assembly protein FimT/FimU [Deinococcus altitudinis]|uniref:Tfp pilus assembly protein FimT/FimU n=1 Tax=Deinococcus altitudinis TaxID=468914 RepID=UPI003891F003